MHQNTKSRNATRRSATLEFQGRMGLSIEDDEEEEEFNRAEFEEEETKEGGIQHQNERKLSDVKESMPQIMQQ